MWLDELVESAKVYLEERLEDEPATEELLKEIAKDSVPVYYSELVEVLQEDFYRIL